MSRSSTRDELLALDPAALLSRGLRAAPGGPDTELSIELAGTGALAMSEQLRHAGVHTDAVALCMVSLDRLRERVPRGAPLDEAHRRSLAHTVRVQCHRAPIIERWMLPLCANVRERRDLDAAIDFLERVHRVWHLGEAIRRRGDLMRFSL